MKDSAPEKWIYREHTRVKHEILGKYLGAWIRILGNHHSRICYFDGFAGRGEYTDGTRGSPVIAVEIAGDLVKQGSANQVACVFIEKDPDNYKNLESVIAQCDCSGLKIHTFQNEFAEVIQEILEKIGGRLVPSFFFIDPFGFSGVPFGLVSEILAIPRTEVFFTFMYRELGRFLERSELEPTIDELFGTDRWRECRERIGGQREHCLRELYITQLREQAGAKYVWPFKVRMTEKRQTLYYLIHATNHFRGLDIMKGIMYRQGAGGTFAYLGPDDAVYRQQMRLFVDDAEDTDSLKTYLLQRFAGETLTYEQVKERSYQETPSIDEHYRRALKELRGEEKIAVKPVSSKTERGLGGHDLITFP